MALRILLVLAAIAISAAPSNAQMAVIDPLNLQQAVLIAERTQRHLEELQGQYRTIMRMSRGLEGLERYRTPTIARTQHDPRRWQYGGAWLAGLNSGDPTGAAYASTTVPLDRVTLLPSHTTTRALRAIDRQAATIEIADSVAMMAGHQLGAIRQYSGRLEQNIRALEDDVVNTLPRFHELTAILDKVAAGELIGRRQDMAANQLLSHAVEQLLARGKRLRDAEAATMNMQLTTWRHSRSANAAMVTGASDALRTWRQP